MVGDAAYVGEELSRGLRDKGVEVKQITFNHKSRARYFKATLTPFQIQFSDADIVHAHYLRFPGYASYLTKKPYIIHCHGSDIRYGLNGLQRRVNKKAKAVIVSTEPLLSRLPEATWLPNPVGPQFFNQHKPRNGTVYFRHQYLKDPDFQLIEQYYPKPLVIMSRNVCYEQMPDVLNQFEMLINTPVPDGYRTPLHKVSLEALACGTPVLMHTGEIYKELPVEHRREVVTQKLLAIYDSVLNKC